MQSYDKAQEITIPVYGGLGDNIIFYKVFSEIRSIYGDKNIVIMTGYPEVYQHDQSVKVVDISQASKYVDLDHFNVYKFMSLNRWRRTIAEAYKEMLIKNEKRDN